jgi:hypothetical protein
MPQLLSSPLPLQGQVVVIAAAIPLLQWLTLTLLPLHCHCCHCCHCTVAAAITATIALSLWSLHRCSSHQHVIILVASVTVAKVGVLGM